MKAAIRKRPWLFIWVAFVILIGAWALLITVAVRNAPENVPLNGTAPAAAPAASENAGEEGSGAD